MKFVVKVIMETDLYIEVEADSEEEAYDIAVDTDGAEYLEDGPGDWRITSVEKLNET